MTNQSQDPACETIIEKAERGRYALLNECKLAQHEFSNVRKRPRAKAPLRFDDVSYKMDPSKTYICEQ